MFGKPRIPRHCLLEVPRTRRPWGWWLTLSIGLIALTVVAIGLAEASGLHSPQPIAETDTGRMTLRALNEQSPSAEVDAPLLNTQVRMSISGMVATVTYQQTFHNPSHSWVEGRYLFPLPETAAVHAMSMRIGERRIVGEIKEKHAARQLYQQAKKTGQRTSLVEQQRPNLFTQHVANIAPGESIEVSLSYRQTVDYQHGRFQLRLPLTITPRYIPGQTVTARPLDDSEPSLQLNAQGWGWSSNTDQVADADQITPPMTSRKRHPDGKPRNPVSLDINLNAGMPLASIDSPYHDIVIAKQGQRHHISFSQGREPMDRDFVLSWQPVAQQAPKAALFRETLAGEDYLMLMLMPPDSRTTEVLPRDVTFIIDTSGSMAGTSIEQAKASLQLALNTLRDDDRFNIVAFNSNFAQYAPHSQPASAHHRQRASQYVSGLEAGGGTEMFAPLQTVLSTAATPGYLKQVIFITDGSVGNESALLQLIEQQLGSARLFIVGIGSAPNSFFMRKSAQFGRGSFTHIGAIGEVTEKMSNLFQQLQAPMMRDIQLQWPDGLNAEVFPIKQPDLYHAQPLLLKAKLADRSTGTVTVSGQTPTGRWQQSISLQPNSKPSVTESKPLATESKPDAKDSPASGIASLWARDKIAALMDQQHTGTPEAEIKPQVLKVALQHQLMSRFTSFIAVEQTPARPLDSSLTAVNIPNLLAKGQQAAAFPQVMLSSQTQTALPYPQTALGLNSVLLQGCGWLLLTLLLALGLRFRSRTGVAV